MIDAAENTDSSGTPDGAVAGERPDGQTPIHDSPPAAEGNRTERRNAELAKQLRDVTERSSQLEARAAKAEKEAGAAVTRVAALEDRITKHRLSAVESEVFSGVRGAVPHAGEKTLRAAVRSVLTGEGIALIPADATVDTELPQDWGTTITARVLEALKRDHEDLFTASARGGPPTSATSQPQVEPRKTGMFT